MFVRISSNWILVVCLLVCGCSDRETAEAPTPESNWLAMARPTPDMSEFEADILKTNVSEELVLHLTPRLNLVAEKFKGQKESLDEILLSSVNYQGPDSGDLAEFLSPISSSNKIVTHLDWPLQAGIVAAEDVSDQLWAPFLSQVKFDDVQFGILDAELLDDEDTFRLKTSLEARFRFDGQIVGVKAKQTIDWELNAEQAWMIAAWKQDKVELIGSKSPLFENVTEKVIADESIRKSLSRSAQHDLIVERARNYNFLQGKPRYFYFFADFTSLHQYASASVVDFDGDQWDDVLILDRWDAPILLRNNQDGTFEDVSAECGLGTDPIQANCALFADFDNDGDPDLLLGGASVGSRYFENKDGKFVEDLVASKELKYVRFVTAASAADINRDGLLDVYLSTYCSCPGPDNSWMRDVTDPADVEEMKFRVDGKFPFLDRRGPPNVLLMNVGGKLKRVPIDNTLKQWRDSFQSIWHDIDQDGDQDLYVCNDFANDVVLRNETERGSMEVKFTECTSDVVVGNSMAFGMGASLGDYDTDGDLDLYVSNMYSKAGQRIIRKMGGDVDAKIRYSSEGNFLYQNTDGQFQHVAGLEDGKQHVSKVGWSFGGQFADYNNDGKLDLHVPSGFFTAPKSVEDLVDS